MLVGLNPRRPYDEDHRIFARLLSRLLDTSVASAMLIEDEARRAKTAAKRVSGALASRCSFGSARPFARPSLVGQTA